MRSRNRAVGKCWMTLAAVFGPLALVSCAELARPANGQRSDRSALTGGRASAAVLEKSTFRSSRATIIGSAKGGARSAKGGVRSPASATPARVSIPGDLPASASGSPLSAGAAPAARLAVAHRPGGEPSARVAFTAAPEPIGPPPPPPLPVPGEVFLSLWRIEAVPSDLLNDLDDSDPPESLPDPAPLEVSPEDFSKDAPKYADSLRVDNAPQRGPGDKLLQWVRDQFEQMERAAADPFAAPFDIGFDCPRQAVIQQRLDAERP